MKKSFIFLLVIIMCGLMSISLCGSESIYDDVLPDAWYSKSVERATKISLVSGVGNNLFKPEDLMTREQVAMILYNWQGNGAVYDSYHFSDVKADAWYADAVEWMYRNGFTYGINEKEYGVGRYITRQDLITLIYRVNQEEWETLFDKDQSKYSGRFDNIYQFADYKEVSDYSFKAMRFATGLNAIRFQHAIINETPIIWGDNNNKLNPRDNCTRAEAVVIIERSHSRVVYDLDHH